MMHVQVIIEGSMNSSNPYFSSSWRRNYFVSDKLSMIKLTSPVIAILFCGLSKLPRTGISNPQLLNNEESNIIFFSKLHITLYFITIASIIDGNITVNFFIILFWFQYWDLVRLACTRTCDTNMDNTVIKKY